MVLDELARRFTNGGQSCDRGGRLAAAGSPDPLLLECLLAEPVLTAPPPRSLGQEQFGPAFVDRLLEERPPHSDRDWHDLFATVTELTAQAIARSYQAHVARHLAAAEAIVAGGGAHNPELMRRLAAALAPLPVTTTERHGVPVDHKEAIAFALLASARLDGVPGNLPEVTGARRPVLLGKVSEG
jgi:anhydro-N-acetylmuramic acid kinase